MLIGGSGQSAIASEILFALLWPYETIETAITSELPGETAEFVDALGLANHSQLQANGAGQGLELLTADASQQLSSDDFWATVERFATGRRLVIASDHGYPANREAAAHFKQTFSSGRGKTGNDDAGSFVPPVALQIDSPHGAHLLALGRRKWRSQGGYPTLTHGGLSLLEVLSPFVELN